MRANEFVLETVLNELNMAPGNLAAFAASPAAANMQAGFEAELVFTKLEGGTGDNDDLEPDYSYDESVSDGDDIDSISTFFDVNPKYDSSCKEIESEYEEWMNDQYANWSEQNYRGYFRAQLEKEQDNDPDYDEDENAEELEQRTHDAMLDEFYGNGPSIGEFLQDIHCRTYHDVMRRFDFSWPHLKGGGDWMMSAQEVAETIQMVTGTDAIVSGEYHASEKDGVSWYVEPDGSINANDEEFTAEVVSPPMPVMQMLDQMEAVLNKLEVQYGASTNRSTGLHVGVSIAGLKTHEVDYVKLALFLGDNYVLQQFGRMANTYTKSTLNYLAQRSEGYGLDSDVVRRMRYGLMTKAANLIAIKNNGRYFSINYHGDYVEFRSMGGYYMDQLPQVKNTILRYVRAYAVAADPEAEKQEYAKKLAKLINPGNNDDLNVFVNYMAHQQNAAALGLTPDEQALTKRMYQQNMKATLANRQGKAPGQPQLARTPAPALPDRKLPIKPQPTSPPLPDGEF